VCPVNLSAAALGEAESKLVFRIFLKKIGSNFRIADRTLAYDFKNAFKIAEKHHADPANAGGGSNQFR